MPRRREIPFNPLAEFGGPEEGVEWGMRNSDLDMAMYDTGGAPETPLEALMETAPGDLPRTSREELLPLRDVIADAMERVLDERERWVFERAVIERQSIRSIAADLNLAKSWVDRIKHRAAKKLRLALSAEWIVSEYLESKWRCDDEEPSETHSTAKKVEAQALRPNASAVRPAA